MSDVTIGRDVLERYAQGSNRIADEAVRNLAETLSNVDLSDRELVQDLVAGAIRAATRATDSYAEAYYRGMSVAQSGEDFRASPTTTYDQTATVRAIMAIYRQATDEDGDLDEMRLAELLEDRIRFEVNRSSKVGVWRCGQQDRRDVRYARVPVGAETCAWCLMTAGLGYWYMSEEAASHTHAHCDCVVMPSIGRGDVVIDGYDSTVYRDMWREANEALARGDVPDSLAERVDRLAATRKGYRTDTNGALAVMRWKYGLK